MCSKYILKIQRWPAVCLRIKLLNSQQEKFSLALIRATNGSGVSFTKCFKTKASAYILYPVHIIHNSIFKVSMQQKKLIHVSFSTETMQNVSLSDLWCCFLHVQFFTCLFLLHAAFLENNVHPLHVCTLCAYTFCLFCHFSSVLNTCSALSV